MGYAKIDQKGQGLHLRTFSRAFIIDDGQERFVFVTVDSAMVGHDLRLAVCVYYAFNSHTHTHFLNVFIRNPSKSSSCVCH